LVYFLDTAWSSKVYLGWSTYWPRKRCPFLWRCWFERGQARGYRICRLSQTTRTLQKFGCKGNGSLYYSYCYPECSVLQVSGTENVVQNLLPPLIPADIFFLHSVIFPLNVI